MGASSSFMKTRSSSMSSVNSEEGSTETFAERKSSSSGNVSVLGSFGVCVSGITMFSLCSLMLLRDTRLKEPIILESEDV